MCLVDVVAAVVIFRLKHTLNIPSVYFAYKLHSNRVFPIVRLMNACACAYAYACMCVAVWSGHNSNHI